MEVSWLVNIINKTNNPLHTHTQTFPICNLHQSVGDLLTDTHIT